MPKPKPKAVPNTTLTIETAGPKPAAGPWTAKVRYEQLTKGVVTLVRESVDAYQRPSGKWVVRHRDIKVSMHIGDRITTPDGTVLVVESFQGGAEVLLHTKPLDPQPAKPKK